MDWIQMVTIPVGALISGYIGARIKVYVDRAKPEVLVASCRLSEDRDLLTASVKIPPDLQKQTEVQSAQHLVVDVVVANRGHIPLLLSPWAKLELHIGSSSSARRLIKLVRTTPLGMPDDPLSAARQEKELQELDDPILQEPGGVSVKGAESLRVQYQSTETIKELETTILRLRQVLDSEAVTCCVHLYRYDKPEWISSRSASFRRDARQWPDSDPPGSIKIPFFSKGRGGLPA